jgi:hypothetical protein
MAPCGMSGRRGREAPLAALDAAPGGDVVITEASRTAWAKSGGGCPTQSIVIYRRPEPAHTIPASHLERIDWLFDRWRRFDEWVEVQG